MLAAGEFAGSLRLVAVWSMSVFAGSVEGVGRGDATGCLAVGCSSLFLLLGCLHFSCS